MFGLKKEKAGVVYGVLFDIGSESVGVAIVESNRDNEYPTVIFSHRVHMRITKMTLTSSERLRYMREALFSASLIISRDGIQALTLHDKHARVSDILITVSAPWSHTLSRNVHYEGEKDLKVTRALLDDLVASAESEISTHLAKIDNDAELAYEVVERATVDVRINDYPIKEPLGLHGKEVSLMHVTGIIPADILDAVREVEEKIFPSTKVRSHTFLLVLYCILRELFTEHDALTIVHVTGESTELGIVENGTLIESISIPYGLNTIVRSLMSKKDQTMKEIHSELLLYHENNLAAERSKEIESHLTEYKKMLIERLQSETLRRFPGNAFVLAPLSFTELFKDVLAPVIKDELNIKTEILTLKADVLSMSAEGGTEDTNISVASRFFHKLHGCGEFEGT
jgi:hypothetical protein